MKKFAIGIAMFIGVASVAYASCPPSAPYRCVPTITGKQICGCGY